MRVVANLVLVALLMASAHAQDSTTSSEQKQVIEKARELALAYAANLPNFIATETIRRSEQQVRSKKWDLLDTLTVDVAFSEEGERYQLVAINGEPANKTYHQLQGIQFEGEFGTLLRWVFRPESETTFHWERSAELRRRPMNVFSYSVDQNHSEYKVFGPNHQSMFAAFSGMVFVDGDTGQVMRITDMPSGIPESWQIETESESVDYGFVDIAGKGFLLPVQAEATFAVRRGSPFRNEIEFGNYRKFSADLILKFEPR
jgi:hypothetical protein